MWEPATLQFPFCKRHSRYVCEFRHQQTGEWGCPKCVLSTSVRLWSAVDSVEQFAEAAAMESRRFLEAALHRYVASLRPHQREEWILCAKSLSEAPDHDGHSDPIRVIVGAVAEATLSCSEAVAPGHDVGTETVVPQRTSTTESSSMTTLSSPVARQVDRSTQSIAVRQPSAITRKTQTYVSVGSRFQQQQQLSQPTNAGAVADHSPPDFEGEPAVDGDVHLTVNAPDGEGDAPLAPSATPNSVVTHDSQCNEIGTPPNPPAAGSSSSFFAQKPGQPPVNEQLDASTAGDSSSCSVASSYGAGSLDVVVCVTVNDRCDVCSEDGTHSPSPPALPHLPVVSSVAKRTCPPTALAVSDSSPLFHTMQTTKHVPSLLPTVLRASQQFVSAWRPDATMCSMVESLLVQPDAPPTVAAASNLTDSKKLHVIHLPSESTRGCLLM